MKMRSPMYFRNFTGCQLFLLFCGLFLTASEIWKQWYLTAIINQGQFDWWYFPFQLCSVPMYILLILPLVTRPSFRGPLITFLMCFGMLGGIAVFADTSGLHYPAAVLTIHSYLWHILLLFIGLTAGISYKKEYKSLAQFRRDFVGSTLIYIICCGIASVINAAFGSYGTINMFYINPRYQMEQVVFCRLVKYIGNTPTILLYIAATIFGGYLLSCIWNAAFLMDRKKHLSA